MCSSSSQYSSRSFEETSALLPIETKLDSPSPRVSASSSSARPSAPLCEENAIRPGGAARRANVAFSRLAVDATPRQFGPISRAVRPHEREQLLLACSPLGAGLGEAGRDDAEGLHAGGER